MGDPAGIGPEITALAWAALQHTTTHFFVIGDPDLYQTTCTQLELPPVQLIHAPEQCASRFATGLPVLPLALSQLVRLGTPSPVHANMVIQSIKMAVEFCQTAQAAAIVTNPIAKSVLYQAGFTHPGHTEFLGELAETFADWPAPKGPIMMLCGGGLRVALASVHVSLADVPAQITTERVVHAAQVLHHALQQDFAIATPRIALCALNPHAGEDGAMGSEERDILNPLAQVLRAQDIDISNAIAADTLFREENRRTFDAALAMYHDQGLIPVKTLDFHGGTNVTLGLPFVRVSPDHGTGFDIAGKGLARADSLIAAIKLAQQLAAARNLSS